MNILTYFPVNYSPMFGLGALLDRAERFVISATLLSVTLLVSADLFYDLREGVNFSHALVEGLIAGLSLLGFFFVLRGSFSLRHQLHDERESSARLKEEARAWRENSRRHVEGLSKAIDEQLTRWNLSEAEKQVAFLLLKGLSLKEIAEVRSTTEKTARAQSMAIYSKSGLAGRSELSAYFLEDLLAPSLLIRH